MIVFVSVRPMRRHTNPSTTSSYTNTRQVPICGRSPFAVGGRLATQTEVTLSLSVHPLVIDREQPVRDDISPPNEVAP